MTKTPFQKDPLQEKKYEVLPGLIWKYPNRILLLTTIKCPFSCSFCFRKELYGKNYKRAGDEEIVQFIKKHTEIKEFIFSGGEPLIVLDEIYKLAKKLVLIDHLKIFRIHTHLPVITPNKLNISGLKELVNITTKPWYLVIHVNSPNELRNKSTRDVIYELRRMGFILLSHTVFLNGINANVKTLETLFSTLIELGIKPYYIFHCDNMKHTQKFIIPLKTEIKIMTELRKKLSGLAYPIHVIDSLSGKGKIPVPTEFWQCDIKTYKDFLNKKNPEFTS